MAFTLAASPPRELIFEWQGTNLQGQPVRGQMRAWGENQAMAMLRRQGVQNLQVMRPQPPPGGVIKPNDIAIFTRQLAAMLQAGVPLLQSFDALGRGHANARMVRMLDEIRADVETGTALSAAFRRHPAHFDPLYCNLVAAGEAAGILDILLDRLALHMEKTEALKAQLRSALTYPAVVVLVALVVIAVIMIFVIPSFQRVFASFGAELPGPTLIVMQVSAFFVAWWWLLVGLTGLGIYAFVTALRRNQAFQRFIDRWVLRLPFVGALIEKACIARWTRTLSTLFAAGLPLMDALDSAAGTTGNSVYALATAGIQKEVSSGSSLNRAMDRVDLFPPMLLQMCMIGEESGSLDAMLSKAAGFLEGEVDQQVGALATLLEPFIIVTLGVLIGGIVVSMYLPIFQMGQVI